MAGENDELQFDFGDPELNDPNYEQNVGNDDGTTHDDNAPAQGEGQGSDGAQNGEQRDASEQAGVRTGARNEGDQAAQQQQRQAEDARAAAQGRIKADKDGNLVDKDGKIVAHAGADRRNYERVQQQAQYIQRLEADIQALRDTDAVGQSLNGMPAQMGLDARETELGLQTIAAFKKDPVSTARWLLQETMRMGYNLPQIIGQDAQGQINGGSLDLAAIKSMIAEQVQPLLSDRSAQQREQQLEQEAQRDYEAFIAKHEHASVHEEVIGNMLNTNPSLTPEVAYWQLREYAAKHQLDFAQPLRDQVEARERGQQPPQRNGNATPQTQMNMQQPMPNGSMMTQDMQPPTMANPDEAWDSIVQQSLREAGFA